MCNGKRCGMANPLLNVCCSSFSKFECLQVQLIEQVFIKNGQDIEKVLWLREKFWQAQLFTLSHGLKSPGEWYALNRKSYRK